MYCAVPFPGAFIELDQLTIDHFQKYHNTLCFIPPKFCISIAFIFSWDHSKSQEKKETMFMQNFGGTNKEYYGIFESGLLSWSPFIVNRLENNTEFGLFGPSNVPIVPKLSSTTKRVPFFDNFVDLLRLVNVAGLAG